MCPSVLKDKGAPGPQVIKLSHSVTGRPRPWLGTVPNNRSLALSRSLSLSPALSLT